MSMSKSTSLASGANMCSSVGQSRPCRCTVSSMASERGSVRRISAFSTGASIVVLAEAPELELHRGLAAVAEPPDGLDARTVEPQHGGLAVRGEPAVGEQHRHPSGGAVGRDRRGVERLVRERVGEGAGHGLAIGTVDGDDRVARRCRARAGTRCRPRRVRRRPRAGPPPSTRRGVICPFRRAYCPLRMTRSSRSNRARRGADATSTSSAASASRMGGAGDGSRFANACPVWSCWSAGRSRSDLVTEEWPPGVG